MNKEDLWKIYVGKNPSFADGDSRFTMSGRGLKKLFEQTYDAAHSQGVKNGKALAEMEAKKPAKSSAEATLKSMFGL